MGNIIQQLLDLKEWGQDPTRYERRMNFRGGQLVQPGQPGVRQRYSKTPTSRKYIEKGIYRRDNGNYRLVANREGAKKLDKTLPKGSTLEDAQKALRAWENANPIKVKWEKGQKIKVITEGPVGKQVNVDIKYKTPKIEADFKAAMADFAGENKGGWSKAKFENTFGGIADDAMQFVRQQDTTLIRDVNKIQTLKYADELEELGYKDWNAAIKAGDDKLVMSRRWHKLNPYERTGSSVAREQIAKNIGVLNKFEKSGQTLEYFYDIVKDRTFKKNLRAYLNGTAGEFVTEAFDEAGIKTKYKNILPKIKDHLEVWHNYEKNPGTAYKGQLKKAKIKKWSDLHTENMINTAKRVSLKDYKNQLDLAHRQDLVIDQNISELGIEKGEINRVLIKDAELERNKLHRKNFELVDEIKKGNNVEKNLRLINENNARITKIAELTKGRLTGIIINPDTLEAVKLKPSNIMGVDAGILNKSMKDLNIADKKVLRTQILPQIIKEARAMTPQKIATDLADIMQDETLSKKLATRMKNLKPGKQITKHVFEQSNEIYKLMQVAKTAKGPAKFKAINAIISTVGIAAAASLFDKFGIKSAMADTGVASPGITGGDIALASAAPLATKKGRGLYKKALSGAGKILSTTPGFLGVEAFVGPGMVASAGGSLGETLAAPFLLEGPMRNKRIYAKLKDEGLSTEDIETVKDSLMLDADPFMSSMMPVSEEATSPKIRGIATNAYDWASHQIDEEDKARLERADKFDYLQDTGFAGGGIAGLSGGKRFGPPPLSGPDPYGGGLSSQYNRVKKLTG